MKIKQLLLAGLLIGSTIQPDLCEQINWNEWQDSSYEKDAAEEFAESFSSGVPALDDLEINKLAEYAEKYWMDKVDQFSDLSACKLTDEEMIIVQRFIGKGAGLALRIGMTLTQLEDRLDDEGLLVCDAYGGEFLRAPRGEKLSPSRRKSMMRILFAQAARRLHRIMDAEFGDYG